jgi:hypothetical protein
VRVFAWGHSFDDTPPSQCIPLDAPVGSFTELEAAVRGKLELALPESGLAGIDVAGLTGGDCFGDAIFYGGAEYNGGDMVVPLAASSDCAVRSTLVVRPVDFRALLAGTCVGISGRLDRGSIHPTMLDAPLPTMVYDLTEPAALVGADGTAVFADALLPIDPDTCLAVGDETTGSIGCIEPGAPGVCTTSTQVELTTIDSDFANASMDADAGLEHAQVVFGAVWDATATIHHPIAGARITIVGEDNGGEVHYATLPLGSPSLVDMPAATTTDPSGLFVAYMDHPMTVQVSAAGYGTRQVTLSSADYIFGATTIVLRPN